MSNPPTVIVLAARSAARHTASQGLVGAVPNELEALLRRVLASGLPLVLVTDEALAERARQLLPGKDVVTLDDNGLNASQWTAQAVAAGVQASARSSGWLILQSHQPAVQIETLHKVARALTQHTLVYPQYQLTRGHPMAFSGELYSELIHLQSERDLSRLSSRYPVSTVEVDDAGVLEADARRPSHASGRTPSSGAQVWG